LHTVEPFFSLEEVEVLIGSPPCAQFSSLGMKRKDRGKLDEIKSGDFDYWKFAHTIKKHQFPTFILENVPKILKHFEFYNEGLFLRGKLVLEMPGYAFQTIILDAQDFGVPQSRKRAFVIGSRMFHPNYNPNNYVVPEKYQFGKTVADAFNKPIQQTLMPNHSEERKTNFNELQPGQSYYGTQNNRRLYTDRPAFTITSHCTRHVHPIEPRVLSVKENARLMGFPDDFHFEGTESQQLDQIGKGVVPQIVYSLCRYIQDELERTTQYN